MAAQAGTLARIGMPRAIGMRHATPHFAHVFAGDGYSSGYYSYMWSEVMDADAFAAFEEAGDAFDKGLADKLERHILSAGGSRDAAELYTAFPGPHAGGWRRFSRVGVWIGWHSVGHKAHPRQSCRPGASHRRQASQG